MSKQKNQGFKMEDFGHVTDGLVKRIEGVIEDRKRSRLSSGAIYKAHNELFKLREPIQTCQSCLIIRGDKLAKWYEWYAREAAPKTASIQMPVTNAGTEGTPEGAAAQATHDLHGGSVMTVLADQSVQIDGNVATEGTYALAGGGTIKISADGKIVPEATTYDELIAKYGIQFDETSERQTIGTNLETGLPEMTAAETALLQARFDALPIEVKGSADEAKQILLQKIDKDDYTKTEGDPFYAAFSASEGDALKGKAVETETGKAVKPGTYATEDTAFVLSVSVGGAAAYKAVQ